MSDKIGSYKYQGFLKFLELSFNNKWEINLFNHKGSEYFRKSTAPRGRSMPRNNALLVGGTDIESQFNSSSKIGMEINLEVTIPELLSPDFDMKNISDIQDILDQTQEGAGVIQTAQKQGLEYTISNYSIKKVHNKIKLILIKKENICTEEYDANFNLNSEYGHVSFITSVNTLPFVFTDICADMSHIDNTINSYKYLAAARTPLYSGDGTIPAMLSTKIFLDFLVKKKYLNIQPEFIDNIGIQISGIQLKSSGSCYEKVTFKDIVVKDLNISRERIPIEIYPEAYELIKHNFMNPMDIFSYALSVSKTGNGIDLISSYDVIDSSLATDIITPAIKSINFSGLVNIESSLSFIEPEKTHSFDDIKNHHIANYDLELDILKTKWNKTLSTYRRIVKGKSDDEAFFAMRFIKKYFIPKFQRAYNLPEYLRNRPSLVTEYFKENYGSFNDFFGIPDISRYLKMLSGIKGQSFHMEGNRMAKLQIGLANLTSNNSSAQYASYIYPNIVISNLDSNMLSYYKKSRSYIIINDTGTKTSWKSSVKSYIDAARKKTKLSLTFLILDPTNKLELMILKKMALNNSMVKLSSSFAKPVASAKKASIQGPTSITYYTRDSFSPHRSKAQSLSKAISNINPAKILFAEYAVSKGELKLGGTTEKINSKMVHVWSDIIKTYAGLTIYFVSKAGINQLKANHDNIVTLDDFLADPDTPKLFTDMEKDFIFYDPKIRSEGIHGIIRFLSAEVINPIYSRRREDRAVLKYWYLIMNSFRPGIKDIFNLLTMFIENNIKGSGQSVHLLTNRLYNKIIEIPDNKNTCVGQIFNVLTSNIDTSIHLEDITNIAHGLEHIPRGNSYHRARAFEFENLSSDLAVVLATSKYLNLSKEQATTKKNIVLKLYNDKWSTIIKIIQKNTKEIP